MLSAYIRAYLKTLLTYQRDRKGGKNMIHYDITEIYSDSGEDINVRLKRKKQTFAEYCKKNLPKKFKFKNNDNVYEAEKFYINVNRDVKIVFVLKKNDKTLNVFSLYECEHPELFGIDYLNLRIDEVIKEDN